MSDHTVLDAALDNTQIPHQPLVVIVDSAVFSGLPVFRESLRRALRRGGDVLYITATDGASVPADGARVVRLGIPGYNDEGEEEDVEAKITSAYRPGAQVYIDAIDIIAGDHGPSRALKIIRSLLRSIKLSKPPSRLTLLLPHTSSFLPSLYPPTLSPALTLLHTYHPQVLSHLSRSYLLPIDSSPNFSVTLDRARERQLPEKLAYNGLDGVEVSGDWSDKGAIVSILVRKATGGTKGITRSIASLVSESDLHNHGGLNVGPVSRLLSVNPIDGPGSGNGPAIQKPAVTHVDLNLPFNLSLTDEQKRRRGEVPLPYAHEGEGVGIEIGEEDDEDDDED